MLEKLRMVLVGSWNHIGLVMQGPLTQREPNREDVLALAKNSDIPTTFRRLTAFNCCNYRIRGKFICQPLADLDLDQIKLLLNGKQATAMASFKQLSDADLAGVITYTRNNWSNKTGEAVAPAEIKAARN